MNIRSRFTFTILALAAFLTPAVALADPPQIACCDSADDPSSCSPLAKPHDLSSCDPAADVGACEMSGGYAIACEPVTLLCCNTGNGWVWGDECVPLLPGSFCTSTVVVEHETVECCQCDGGVAECYDEPGDMCPVGWDYGPLVCTP